MQTTSSLLRQRGAISNEISLKSSFHLRFKEKRFQKCGLFPPLGISCYRILCLCFAVVYFYVVSMSMLSKNPLFWVYFLKIPFCLLPWSLSVSNHCGLAASWSLGWITTPEKSTSFQHGLSGFYTVHGGLTFGWLTPQGRRNLCAFSILTILGQNCIWQPVPVLG